MNIFKFYDKPQIVTVEPFSGIFWRETWMIVEPQRDGYDIVSLLRHGKYVRQHKNMPT